MARALFDANGQREVLLDQLPAVTMPTLIVWGGCDYVLPAYQAQAAVNLLPDGAAVGVPRLRAPAHDHGQQRGGLDGQPQSQQLRARDGAPAGGVVEPGVRGPRRVEHVGAVEIRPCGLNDRPDRRAAETVG
jgi:hypothetical protein